MIEPATARQLVEAILRVEERLTRLLTSGWRQASTEATDLQQEADSLAEAGLPALAARVSAVSAATDASSALHAIALASSACQLIRARLLVSELPDGWQPIQPPKRRKRNSLDTILPFARLQVNGQEVWACACPWPAQDTVILLEPPFPAPPPISTDPKRGAYVPEDYAPRYLWEQPLGSALEEHPPSFWLHHWIRGSLRWAARHPVGSDSELAAYTVDFRTWLSVEETIHNFEYARANHLRRFRIELATDRLQEGQDLTDVNFLGVSRLDQRNWSDYYWVDPSTLEAFRQYPESTPLALTFFLEHERKHMPLALVETRAGAFEGSIVHLVPGLPRDVVAKFS